EGAVVAGEDGHGPARADLAPGEVEGATGIAVDGLPLPEGVPSHRAGARLEGFEALDGARGHLQDVARLQGDDEALPRLEGGHEAVLARGRRGGRDDLHVDRLVADGD